MPHLKPGRLFTTLGVGGNCVAAGHGTAFCSRRRQRLPHARLCFYTATSAENSAHSRCLSFGARPREIFGSSACRRNGSGQRSMRLATQGAASSGDGSPDSGSSAGAAGAGFPSNIGWVPAQQPRSSKPYWPNYVLSREEAVQTQLRVPPPPPPHPLHTHTPRAVVGLSLPLIGRDHGSPILLHSVVTCLKP